MEPGGRWNPAATYTVAVRNRWLTRRAFLLHSEFAIIASGCIAAGWWQATRALSGHFLSWFYTFEWPILAVVAAAGWWHLIHEDPEAFRARKQRPPEWDIPGNEPVH
jgi:hypothetical protein